ncbi:hypothetical protein Pcinc_033443 [Petrolisthes cinctipes]|uniref:Uncharacterized protein n=1 Tax=Petrolisthes cinctipes TaxID=88211 RepID=A0AAE1ESD4_PETCI|nr:hypothetical protein Pcinc_033443 [Petrolisthes cinctipes]
MCECRKPYLLVLLQADDKVLLLTPRLSPYLSLTHRLTSCLNEGRRKLHGQSTTRHPLPCALHWGGVRVVDDYYWRWCISMTEGRLCPQLINRINRLALHTTPKAGQGRRNDVKEVRRREGENEGMKEKMREEGNGGRDKNGGEIDEMKEKMREEEMERRDKNGGEIDEMIEGGSEIVEGVKTMSMTRVTKATRK